MKKRILEVSLALLWALGTVVGYGMFIRYESDPGLSGVSPDRWPDQSGLQRDRSLPTLVMFVHPQCPCTRASIGELSVLMARCQGELTAYVVFFDPAEGPVGWVETDLYESVRTIPGVLAERDANAVEARIFQVETSGHVLLYSEEGQLLFSGGITASRGHSGDNSGRSAVMSLVHRRRSERLNTPVFGCSLLEKPSAMR